MISKNTLIALAFLGCSVAQGRQCLQLQPACAATHTISMPTHRVYTEAVPACAQPATTIFQAAPPALIQPSHNIEVHLPQPVAPAPECCEERFERVELSSEEETETEADEPEDDLEVGASQEELAALQNEVAQLTDLFQSMSEKVQRNQDMAVKNFQMVENTMNRMNARLTQLEELHEEDIKKLRREMELLRQAFEDRF